MIGSKIKSCLNGNKGAFGIPFKLVMALAIVLIILMLVSFVAFGVKTQGQSAMETLFSIDKWLGQAAN